MARFYDTLDSKDLERVEHILTFGGIGYTVQAARKGPPMKEIMVAEEDLVYAEMLLSSQGNIR
jgi:hypothetical protein